MCHVSRLMSRVLLLHGFSLQVISDFDEMKELIAKLNVSLEDGEDEDEENEAFLERFF